MPVCANSTAHSERGGVAGRQRLENVHVTQEGGFGFARDGCLRGVVARRAIECGAQSCAELGRRVRAEAVEARAGLAVQRVAAGDDALQDLAALQIAEVAHIHVRE